MTHCSSAGHLLFPSRATAGDHGEQRLQLHQLLSTVSSRGHEEVPSPDTRQPQLPATLFPACPYPLALCLCTHAATAGEGSSVSAAVADAIIVGVFFLDQQPHLTLSWTLAAHHTTSPLPCRCAFPCVWQAGGHLARCGWYWQHSVDNEDPMAQAVCSTMLPGPSRGQPLQRRLRANW